MGLAMAREARLPANETGIRGGVIYASEQVHMVALLGIGRANLRLELELLAPVPLSAVMLFIKYLQCASGEVLPLTGACIEWPLVILHAWA